MNKHNKTETVIDTENKWWLPEGRGGEEERTQEEEKLTSSEIIFFQKFLYIHGFSSKES